ncbi:MAG: CPBP family intramembrane metalloprotease, partial [Oscillospiraceae bacterium]|nr:CPBP family intramembrane metalloprotease [Oscillospiraceae bacterium]
SIRERYGRIAGLILNSSLFMALHLGNPGVTSLSLLNLFLWGAVCTLIVEYTGSMWFVMAAHTAWNFTQNFLFGLPNSGIVSESSFLHLDAASDSLFYDAAFGVEGTLTAVIVIVLFAAGVVLVGRKKEPVNITKDFC